MQSPGGVEPLSGKSGQARTRVGLRARYLRLDLPDDGATSARRPEHALIQELQASFAPLPQLGVQAALPLVTKIPDDRQVSGGLGDFRLGLQAVPLLDAADDLALGVALETTFPTGSERDGFGAGDYVSRVSSFYSQSLGPDRRWRVTAAVGVTWAWRDGTNSVVDYGGSASYAVLEPMGLFVDVRAQTFTRTTSGMLSAVQRRGRQAADTSVVVTPGITFMPGDAWFVSAGPQIPLTRVDDFDVGAALSLQYMLPDF